MATNKTKAELEQENNALNDALSQMQAQMDALMQQFQNMQSNNTTTTVIQQTNDVTNRKVNVISLIPYTAILSTEQFGGGTVYQFNQYGASRKIKYSDLEKIVNVAKQIADNTGVEKSFFERGDFYIADREVVEELGLDYYYDNILTPEMVNDIIALKDNTSIELFRGANKHMQDNIVDKIVDNIVNGMQYDRNLLVLIQDIYGKDIIEMSEQKKKILNK